MTFADDVSAILLEIKPSAAQRLTNSRSPSFPSSAAASHGSTTSGRVTRLGRRADGRTGRAM